MDKRENKAENDIRLGMGTRVRNVIRYCNSIIKEKNLRELHFAAVGGAIGKLLDAVEVLRIVNPGFYQVNKIGTVSYQTVDAQGAVSNQRLYPKFEVTLTLDPPKEKGEGFQDKLEEDERTKLFDLLTQRSSERRPGGERGRGGFRGGRGGFRGGYGEERRGGYGEERRGGFRGGFRGGNRGYGEERRGGFRGGFRGGNRGYGEERRGGFRGGNRGGRRDFDDEYEPRPRGGFRGGFRGGNRGYGRDRGDSFNSQGRDRIGSFDRPRGGFGGPRGGFGGPRGGPRGYSSRGGPRGGRRDY